MSFNSSRWSFELNQFNDVCTKSFLQQKLDLAFLFCFLCLFDLCTAKFAASASKISMNEIPMIFLFLSGSITPFNLPRNNSEASASGKLIPKYSSSNFFDDEHSYCRRIPLPINIAWNLSPIARDINLENRKNYTDGFKGDICDFRSAIGVNYWSLRCWSWQFSCFSDSLL